MARATIIQGRLAVPTSPIAKGAMKEERSSFRTWNRGIIRGIKGDFALALDAVTSTSH